MTWLTDELIVKSDNARFWIRMQMFFIRGFTILALNALAISLWYIIFKTAKLLFFN